MRISETSRSGEYAGRGDYHRHLDPHWSYAPIYARKVRWVDSVLHALSKEARLLDVGAGEGALVERYHNEGWDIVGVDSAYESPHVQAGAIRGFVGLSPTWAMRSAEIP